MLLYPDNFNQVVVVVAACGSSGRIIATKHITTMRKSPTNSISCVFSLVLIIICLLSHHPTTAKLDSGKVHLDGVQTESTVVKFAISASSTAKIDLNLTSYG